ncbi:MAG: flippase [Nanoarchaeota archaeon]
MHKDLGDKNFSGLLTLVAKSSIFALFGITFAKGVNYLFRIGIARYFGPESYGLFSLGMAIAGWFMALATLGLNEGLSRYIPLYRGNKEEEKIKYLVRFSLTFLTITGILSAAILFFSAELIAQEFFHNQELTIFIRLFSIAIPLVVIAHPFLSIIRSYEKIGWYSFIVNILQSLVKIGFLAIFILAGASHSSTATAHLIALASILIFSYLVCKHYFSHLLVKSLLNKKDKKALRKEVWTYSSPLLFLSLISTILYWVDSIFLGYYKGIAEVGLYNAALPIAALLSVVPEIFMLIFFPLITKEYGAGRKKVIFELSKQVSKWIFLLNLPLFLLIVLFPGAAINLLFGAKYLPAETSLQFLSAGMFLSSVLVISTYLITMLGKSKLNLMNVVLASVMNVVLNIILIPIPNIWFIDNSTGLPGASIATLISIIFLNGLFLFQVYKNLHFIPFRRKNLLVILSAVLPTLFVLIFRSFIQEVTFVLLLLLVIGFFLLYFISLYLFGSLDKNDIFILYRFRKKLLRR